MSLASVSGIDHAVVLVRDLDAGRDFFARLGFTISPRGKHSARMGTANHTIMLRDEYVELVGVLAPTEANARRRAALERREGLHEVALRSDMAERTASELRALGFPDAAPIDFSRPIDGGREAAFRVVRFPPEASPEFGLFACQHLTPENVWLPALMEHANTAVAIASVTVVSDAPQALLRPYEHLLGNRRVARTEDGLILELGTARVRFVRPETLAERYRGIPLPESAPPCAAALSIRVRDPAAARHALRGVPTIALGDTICVPPSESPGVLVEFVG